MASTASSPVGRSPGDVGAIVVSGVEGSGKSTVGAALAARLGVPFLEGDDLQPAGNVARMASGHPLSDEDRAPWLRAVGERIAELEDGGVVAACSALKRAYRDVIRRYAPAAYFVQLTAAESLIASRIASRHHAYMPSSLLASQLAILEPLEPDEQGAVVDAGEPPEVIVELLARGISRRGRHAARKPAS